MAKLCLTIIFLLLDPLREPAMGIEPMTFFLPRRRSATEPRRLIVAVVFILAKLAMVSQQKSLTGAKIYVHTGLEVIFYPVTKHIPAHRWIFSLALLALLSLAVTVSIPRIAGQHDEKKVPPGQEYVPGELIVKFKPGNAPDENFRKKYNLKAFNNIVEKHNLRRGVRRSAELAGVTRLYKVKLVNETDFTNALRFLNNDPQVEYAEPNFILSIQATPNDPDFSKLWGLHNTGQTGGTADADIDGPEAWDKSNDSSVTVGVIDTGIDYNHPDLKENIWVNQGEIPGNGTDDDGNGFIDDYYGWDFSNKDNDPMDDRGHGTHVAGTIAAVGNNGVGVAGVNWTGKVAAIKFLSSSGSGTLEDAVAAVQYATMMGFKITSNSWGCLCSGYNLQSLYDAISAANTAGSLFVAAAGNSGVDNDFYKFAPASFDLPNIISVAATDHNDNLPSWSNYGKLTVDLGAPGVSILSTIPGGSYSSKSGTSMATPHVSGAAALVWASEPTSTHIQIKDKILNLTDSLDTLTDKTVSGGRLNIGNVFDDDETAPAAVTDLSSESVSFSSVILSWTAVGDDGLSGQASHYDVRYSASPITESNWSIATPAAGEPKPSPSGAEETFAVTGLDEQTKYYFALKVRDNVGNISGLSNLASATTSKSTVVFSDNMESGINGWTAEGLWHLEKKRSVSPTTSWAYNTGSPNYNYDIGTNKGSLTSKPLDLSNLGSALLKFNYYYHTEGPGTTWDQRTIHIGVNGSFNKVAQLWGDDMLSWNTYSLDLSNYAGKSNVQIRFYFDTIDSILNNYEGWYIDDVSVLGSSLSQNNPPIADAGGPYAGKEDSPVNFDGSASSDPDGDTLVYSWDFGDGGTGTGATPAHTYVQAGTYNVTLTVSDGELSSTDVTTAQIIEVNDAPVADAGSDKEVKVGDTVNFDGSGSTDEEGPIVTYEWDFGDGTKALGQIVEHTYWSVGEFTVTLTVTDGDGATAQDSAKVTVLAADEVNIIKARHNGTLLDVEARSTKPGEAVLTIVGYGAMDYSRGKRTYTYKEKISPAPQEVTVVSSYGGSDTVGVTTRGGVGQFWECRQGDLVAWLRCFLGR